MTANTFLTNKSRLRTLLSMGATLGLSLGSGLAAEALKDGLYARIDTSKGEILLALEYEKTPMTVANFVGLAEGRIKNDHKKPGTPFYDGLKFHRVIADFMIQGGCPLGTGSGGPGYRFPDEIDPSLKHSGPGILSMANAGPGTNGSQFFITHKATPWLDGKHTVFGNVVKGKDVVDAIAKDDTLKKVTILRVGEKAKAFQADQEAFDQHLAQAKQNSPAMRHLAEGKKFLAANGKKDGVKQTDTGLQYKILTEGKGGKPAASDTVTVHYRGTLLDGSEFDSSYKRNEPATFPLGRVIPGWTEGLQLVSEGGKIRLWIPPHIAYGERGFPPVIPPNSTLTFEIELIKIN